jgi:hypothetical protein
MASKRAYKWATLVVAILGVLVALGAWFFPVQVTRQGGTAIGDDPFMNGVVPDQSGGVPPAAGKMFVAVTPPPNTGGAFAGDTPGLYGGTRNLSACDPQQMVTFLQQHPDKAAAWASVLGISPDAIAGYVGQLTPVILRSDTYVTNHGFRAGHATSLSSVLQAGTAVLVNKRGEPVTRCFCGNPLTAPSGRLIKTYTGPSWPGFSSDRITTIRPAKADIVNFTLVDPTTNKSFDRPSGTTGDRDKDSNGQAGPMSLDGPWRNSNGAAIMPVDHTGGQTEFHWILLNGAGQGIRNEACTTQTTSVHLGGTAQLACTNDQGREVNLVLTITDTDHISVSSDSNFFFPLSGDYVRCPSADACKPK